MDNIDQIRERRHALNFISHKVTTTRTHVSSSQSNHIIILLIILQPSFMLLAHLSIQTLLVHDKIWTKVRGTTLFYCSANIIELACVMQLMIWYDTNFGDEGHRFQLLFYQVVGKKATYLLVCVVCMTVANYVEAHSNRSLALGHHYSYHLSSPCM